MTLRHMNIFIQVCREESVTRAANTLHMTQPAVTRAIRELEGHYGVRLFDRINRRLYITEVGRQFYAYALHITDSFARMERELKDWDQLGLLRLGTTVTIGATLLPAVLTAARERYPELRVEAKVTNAGSLRSALLENRLDFAVIEGRVNDPLLECRVMGEDRLVPVLSPGDPRRGQVVELRELAADPLLLREEGSMGREVLLHALALEGLEARPALESVSTHALIRAARAGLGVAFLPEALVRERIDSGEVATCQLMGDPFRRDNCLVWHRHKYLTPAARWVMELFVDRGGEEREG